MSQSTTRLSEADITALARRIDRPVVLVGLMGTGKSTVGKRLAAILGRDFTDVDEEIEEAAQLSIKEIFNQFGKDYFRDGERRVIARLMEEKDGVIATGGGAFVNEETRELILDKAIAVWLDCDIDTLVERTGRRNTRPLLQQGNPREILTRLHEDRKPAYSQAQIRVESDNTPHHETVLRILEALDAWL